MAVGRTGQTAVKSEPNVVPMIDIMLVLLIIFMIVTPLIAAGFKATLPKGKNLDPARGRQRGGAESTRRAAISSTGGRFQAPWRTSSARSTPRGKEDKILYFKADNQLKYGKIQEAVETARRSGVRVMAAITEPNQSAASVFAESEAKKKEK